MLHITVPVLVSLLGATGLAPCPQASVNTGGTIVSLATLVDGERVQWLSGPVRVSVRNEVTGEIAEPTLHSRLDHYRGALRWSMRLDGNWPKAGHEATIEFPVLSAARQVFTPSEQGAMSVASYPDYRPVPYGSYGWGPDTYYVLPLVSILGPRTDSGLTIALSPDENIPHLQVEWSAGRVLRLVLGHRDLAADNTVRLLLFAHEADYRGAIGAYSGAFPAYFRAPLPRADYEGAFYYHHIQAHPDYDEMARQDVRFVWTSFWFTFLGEYLPDESEWAPYTFARWWSLHETMTDGRIRAFAREMHDHGVGTFAYFNVTEFGGLGGDDGSAKRAGALLAGPLGDARIRDREGRYVGSWEGSCAMTPRPGSAFRAYLEEQARRHIERLPEIDGFAIDRLDWAGRYDYGQRDGLTMDGAAEAENLAVPIREATSSVCDLAHAAGKRVYVNQFWKVDVLRDVDGYCHEYDFPRGLGYLAPYRPASAWTASRPYTDDLLAFEARLKERLQFAVFPQMIAHEFPISQQGPDPEAADMLEVYAPLFSLLHGKEQVLVPHCVSVSGANEANLFVDPRGRYVVPITSLTRFISRGATATEPVTVTVRVPDAAKLRWAVAYSADGPPTAAAVRHVGDTAEISVPGHGTATVLLVGAGDGPQPDELRPNVAEARTRLLSAAPAREPLEPGIKPSLAGVASGVLVVEGASVGAKGPVRVSIGGVDLGELHEGMTSLPVPRSALLSPGFSPTVRLSWGSEGVWFAPAQADLYVTLESGKTYRIAAWRPGMPAGRCEPWGVELKMRWSDPERVLRSRAVFVGRAVGAGGAYAGGLGETAAFVAGTSGSSAQGYELSVSGRPYVWAAASTDPRVLRSAANATGPATCWFDSDRVAAGVTPPGSASYRLTIYILDYDHNGRSEEVRVVDPRFGTLDTQTVSADETDKGVYLTWDLNGPVTIECRKVSGYNAVVSGVFLDRVR